MGAAEITIIVLTVLIVASSLIAYIVRKVKGKPAGGCAGCPHAKDCGQGGACHGQSMDLSKYKKDESDKNI